MNRCADCQHWKRIDEEEGECHRRAPAPIAVDIAVRYRLAVMWPPMIGSERCGDFQPLPVKQTPPPKKE